MGRWGLNVSRTSDCAVITMYPILKYRSGDEKVVALPAMENENATQFLNALVEIFRIPRKRVEAMPARDASQKIDGTKYAVVINWGDSENPGWSVELRKRDHAGNLADARAFPALVRPQAQELARALATAYAVPAAYVEC